MKTVRDIYIQYKKESPVKYCQKYVCAMQRKIHERCILHFI